MGFKWALLVLSLVSIAYGNTEKIVFVAPEHLKTPHDKSIDNLLLLSLTPVTAPVRTYLNATFRDEDHPKGTPTWFLLEGLRPGQRYEVRMCWAAIQPTKFRLHTYGLQEVFETPALISSLSAQAHAAHARLSDEERRQLLHRRLPDPTESASMLLLQIFSAADYFTLHADLMEQVPPVLVDVLLDPYVLNAVPRSLVPIIGYIAIIAVAAWYLSMPISSALVSLTKSDEMFEQGKDR